MRLPPRITLEPLLVFLLWTAAACAAGPDPGPVREVRAVWIATAAGLDWPPAGNPALQQASLRRFVEALHSSGFTTIFFQVRARGDSYYRSQYEPWAENLTGALGRDPGWDPLASLLIEAHSRGMDVHAWFNVFKIRGPAPVFPSAPLHVSLAHPDWCVTHNDELWLDPGLPEVRTYLMAVALDLIRRYPLDGVNFDFIRYPGRSFDDTRSWRTYGRGGDRDEWRRKNIDTFVEEFYRRATLQRPILRVGSAPLGLYDDDPPSGAGGGYSSVFQDSRGWISRGWHDYLSPQMYWNLGVTRGDPDFAALSTEWARHGGGRHVYAGIAAYKEDVRRELPLQIDAARAAGLQGQAFFRLQHVLDPAALGGRYRTPAVIPSMPWKDSIPPLPPPHLAVTEVATNIFLLEWASPPPARDGDTARFYSVYRCAVPGAPPRQEGTLVSISTGPVLSCLDTIHTPEGFSYTYSVCAFDAGYNESAPSQAVSGVFRELLAIRRKVSDVTSLSAAIPAQSGIPALAAYSLARRVAVRLDLLRKYTVSGDSLVTTIVHEVQEGGMYVVGLADVPFTAGTYVLRLRAGPTELEQPLDLR